MSSYTGDLDSALRQHGEDIVLRRVEGTPDSTETEIDVTVRAKVMTSGSPEALAAGVIQNDIKVIMSMTQIIAEGWPNRADDEDAEFSTVASLPRVGDIVLRLGAAYRVAMRPQVMTVDNEIVRVELLATGGAAA